MLFNITAQAFQVIQFNLIFPNNTLTSTCNKFVHLESPQRVCNVIADIRGIFLHSLAFNRSSPIFIHNHPCKAAAASRSESAALSFPFPISPQDLTDLTASSASFVPTVTAISTSPDLQWMVQPLVSSVAPSRRAHPYSPSPSYKRTVMRSAASKAHAKRGRVEQVIRTPPCVPGVL